MTLRQKVAVGALLVAAYLPIWVVVAALALWAIWHLFWMAVIVAILALVGVGALVEIAVRWVSGLF